MGVADFFFKSLPFGKLLHVTWLQRNVTIAPLEITLNVIALHAFANDISRFDTHLINVTNSFFPDCFFKALGRVTNASNHLPPIAACGAPAYSVGFNQSHIKSTLGKFKGGIYA